MIMKSLFLKGNKIYRKDLEQVVVMVIKWNGLEIENNLKKKLWLYWIKSNQ